MNKNPDIVNHLFESNIGLAYSLANKYYGAGKADNTLKEDIEQAALIGLWMAIKNWDESKGTLGTIAYYYIMDEINNVRRHKGAVSIPYHQFRQGVRPEHKRVDYDSISHYMFAEDCGLEDKVLVDQIKKVKLTDYMKEALDCYSNYSSFTDLSESTGRSRQSISNSKLKAVERIRKELKIEVE